MDSAQLGGSALTRVDSKPILHIMKTMLEDKDVCVRRLREGYEFFKSMSQRRTDLVTTKAFRYD